MNHEANHKNQPDQNESVKCPICKQTTDQTNPTYPFCSKRCKTIDLGKWIKGDYVISRSIQNSDLDEV